VSHSKDSLLPAVRLEAIEHCKKSKSRASTVAQMVDEALSSNPSAAKKKRKKKKEIQVKNKTKQNLLLSVPVPFENMSLL
jgi:hypothetical protein